jgi:soluble lytic murein transglycosylase
MATVATAQKTDTTREAREIFRSGYQAFHAGRFDEAPGLLKHALEVYPILADYSLYYLAEIALKTGQQAEARSRFGRLLTDHTTSPWRAQAALALAQLACEAEQWSKAIQYADQARKFKATPEEIHHQATLVSAQAQYKLGNIAKAVYLYTQLRRKASFSAAGQAAKMHVMELRRTSAEYRPKDVAGYVEEMQLLAREGDRAGLEALTHQFEQKFALGQLSDTQLGVLATVYKSHGRIQDAATALQTVAKRHPGSAKALYRWARLLWNADRDSQALPLFQNLAEKFPRHGLAAEALYAIGRIYQARQDRTSDAQAIKAYQTLAERFRSHELARDGRWRQGWMAYQKGNVAQAEQHFASLAGSAPNTSEGESAVYWQARMLEHQSQPQKAVELYRTLLQNNSESYYALWAEKRLGRRPQPLKHSPALTAKPPRLSGQLQRYYERSQELRQLGLLDAARYELDRMREAAPQKASYTRFFIVEYSHVEGYNEALRLAQGFGVSTRQPYDFPRAYWETLQAHAQDKQLDPYLVLALMRQESLFDPDVVSPARAYGLMQLLPTTAASVAQPSLGEGLRLTDPQVNIALGTSYLRQLLSSYAGNIIMALAGYNAGEKAVDKWRARSPNVEADEFVENISYRETRNYVKKVLRNYRTYLRLYETSPAEISFGPGA